MRKKAACDRAAPLMFQSRRFTAFFRTKEYDGGRSPERHPSITPGTSGIPDQTVRNVKSMR